MGEQRSEAQSQFITVDKALDLFDLVADYTDKRIEYAVNTGNLPCSWSRDHLRARLRDAALKVCRKKAA